LRSGIPFLPLLDVVSSKKIGLVKEAEAVPNIFLAAG